MTQPARGARTWAIAAAALAAAMIIASPSQASVNYLFELIGDGPVLGGFSYTSADFITADRTVAPGSLDSCTPIATATCGDQEFHISSVGFVSGTSDVADVIGFRNIFPGGSSTGFHYFANGAFSTPGVYGAMLLSTDASRLTVTLVRDGVPEPATWAMMLAGFFGLGGVLRRRRALSA